MSLDYFVVLDTDSGTFFCAADAVLLDTTKLSPEELDDLNEGNDSDRRRLGDAYGHPLEALVDPSTLTYDSEA